MKVKVSIVTTAILVIGLLGNFLSESVVPVSAEEIGAIGLSKPIVESIHQVGKSASNKCTLKTSVSSKGVTIKWSVSKKKKSSFKNVQIKVATKKSMKSAKTYKFGKSTAKKGSYQLTVKSGKVKANKTYYIQVRVKVKNKWTKWSSQKKVKTKKATTSKKKTEDKKTEDKKTEEAKNDLSKYKCTHTLEKGVTSKIVKAGGEVFDVHTYTNIESSGYQPIFKVYLMTLNKKTGKGRYADSAGSEITIDYNKMSFSFDNGKSGELWNWLEKDINDMEIYSVPSYKNALVDVYYMPYYGKGYTSCTVMEETIPHKADGSYVAELKYGGESLGKTTRTKRACINNSIKLFKDYGGEQYLQDMQTKGPSVVFKDFLNYNWYSSSCVKNGSITPQVFSLWQPLTFDYFGCQFGTLLGISLSRYYCPDVKLVIGDSAPPTAPGLSSVTYRPELMLPMSNGQFVYAPRYKEINLQSFGTHVAYYYFDPSEEQGCQWVACPTTGSTTGLNGVKQFPGTENTNGVAWSFDFLGLVYE